MNHRPRVVFIQRALLEYRQPFFDHLRPALDAHGIEMRLIHASPSDDARQWTAARPWAAYVPIHQIKWRGIKISWHPVRRHIAASDMVVLQHAGRRLENYLLLSRRNRRPKATLWGHGTDLSADRSAAGDLSRRWMIRHAHWYFAYTHESAARAVARGMTPDRVTVVRNATDTGALATRVAGVDQTRRQMFRNRLGLTGDCLGVFIGTDRPKKRLDYLLAASDHIRDRVPGFELVIAARSNDPRKRALEGREGDLRERPWVHVIGEQYGENLAVLLASADLLLIPGWAGLAVVDGFAAGLPTIASRAHPHPPEVEYIRDDENGLVIDDAGSAARYGDGVADLLLDPVRLRRLAAAARRDCAMYCIETMVDRFTNGIDAALRAR